MASRTCFLLPIIWYPAARLTYTQFPIGMGTGAVYATLAGIKEHNRVLTHVEIFFYFLNIALFLFNSSTLLLQAIRQFSSTDFEVSISHMILKQCTQGKRGGCCSIQSKAFSCR